MVRLSLSKSERAALLMVWGGQCAWCEEEITGTSDWEADHFLPHYLTNPGQEERRDEAISQYAGVNFPKDFSIESLENMAPMHRKCNGSKSAKVEQVTRKHIEVFNRCVASAPEVRRVAGNIYRGIRITRVTAIIEGINFAQAENDRRRLAKHIARLAIAVGAINDDSGYLPLSASPALGGHAFDELQVEQLPQGSTEWQVVAWDGQNRGVTGNSPFFYCDECEMHTVFSQNIRPRHCLTCDMKDYRELDDPDWMPEYFCGSACNVIRVATPDPSAVKYSDELTNADYEKILGG